MSRLGGTILTVSLVLGACSGGSDEVTTELPSDSIAIVTTTDVGVGPARLLLALAGADGTRLGSPDTSIAIEVAPADRADLRQRADGEFIWIIEDAFGLYQGEFNFDRAGVWQATAVLDGGITLEPAFFEVRQQTFAPGVGEPAPLVPTATLASGQLGSITTDPDPNPAFYEVSLDDAIRQGRTVAVFSTPGFCRTATCGPMLEQVKEIATQHPETRFVHVEIYEGFDQPDFVPGPENLVDAVGPSGWNLPSEPWTFVVDGGLVVSRFEGVLDVDRLAAVLAN